MIMEAFFEDIFGKIYNESERNLWYKARSFVLTHLQPLDGDGIGVGSNDHVHVIFDRPTLNALAIARQISLIAHYPNYNEQDGRNRTIITFYDCENLDVTSINETVDFGHLFEYCLYSKNGDSFNKEYQDASRNNKLPIDVEFEFLDAKYVDTNFLDGQIVIKSQEVDSYFETCKETELEVTKGMLVSMVYQTGAPIDNLPACDNDNVARYATALNVFCYNLRIDEIVKEWCNGAKIQENGGYKPIDVKNQLSSIFCADCFEARLRGLLDTRNKSLSEYLLYDFGYVMEKISDQDTINALAQCEHNRWNVERLILGYSPLDEMDLFKIESCFGQERKDVIKNLKKDFRHIDLCSNKDLRRLNPGDVKYDYFLMLAMPQILLSRLK